MCNEADSATLQGRRKYDVLLLGDANLDIQLSPGPAQLAYGQRELLMDSGSLTPGGSAAITACAASRLGMKTALIGVVGEDQAGHLLLAELAARGVDVSGFRRNKSIATGMTLNLTRGNDRAMLTFAGAMSTTTAAMVSSQRLEQCGHLHVSSIFLQPHLAPGLGKLLNEARSLGVTTSMDTGWDPANRWQCDFTHVLPLVDVLLPNEEEAIAIARALRRSESQLDIGASLEVLLEQGTMPIVKRGPDGSIAILDGQPFHVAARTSNVVDTVGAGDNFDAGFIAGWIRGLGLEKSLALATAAGGLSTEGPGGLARQPTLEEAMAEAASLLGGADQ